MLTPEEREQLDRRFGPLFVRQRLGIEADHVDRVLGGGRTFFHIENWYSIHGFLKGALRCSGLYWRGRRNARRIAIAHNEVDLPHLPRGLNGYTLLHLTDLHLDLSPDMVDPLIERLDDVTYDICVITGDYRARTFGPAREALQLMARVREHLRGPVYTVLGNHDSIEMVPALERLGMTVLLNESAVVERGGERIYLVGVDDPHYYETDNLDKAVAGVPDDAVSIFLSHSPEGYKNAAHAGLDLMLCGHTHGGQICLPGGRAVLRNARCPRRMGRGAWSYHALQGYTSPGAGAVVVDVRLNCRPEITLHHLRQGRGGE
jgi:predicted MPP superfamily phosphohydrolase